jgi:hypothetical protein
MQKTAEDSFTSYLINGKQKVEIKPSSAAPNFFSNWGTGTHGIHKGSILGSLPFRTYTNDVPLTIKVLSEPITSADDTQRHN